MSKDKAPPIYPETDDFLRKKEALRKNIAKRPVSEKMAAVKRLRDLEQVLAKARDLNKALRGSKQIKLIVKTR